jgi:5-methylthioadenosine/S-adenosylhomocysteine deaminase
MSILIKNGYVITVDPQRRMIKDGAVAIEDDRIVAVGKTQDVEKKYGKAEKVIDAKNHAIIPGLINTHTHFFQVLLRSLGDDLKLFDWWPGMVGPAAVHLENEDVYWSALTGSMELLKSGCTCTMDNYYPHPKWGLTDECLKAFTKIGIRAIEAVGGTDKDVPYFPPPRALLKNTDDIVKEVVRLIREWNGKGDGRVNVWFGCGAPFANSDELLEKEYDNAKKYGVGMCSHLHETMDEVNQWKKEYNGLTPIQYYYKKGIRFLGSNFVGIHCVWMDGEDLKIMAETNSKVSHNPVSNMYLASGTCPVPKMLDMGITVSLGVDGPASNNGQDMFELMKSTALLQKVSTCNPTSITAEKVLELATIDGARALLMDNKIGSIEVGKKADITLVNLKAANIAPVNRVVSQLVYCAKASNVDTVIVNGKIIVEKGQLKTMKEGLIIDKVQDAADKLVTRAGIEKLREKKWTSKVD